MIQYVCRTGTDFPSLRSRIEQGGHENEDCGGTEYDVISWEACTCNNGQRLVRPGKSTRGFKIHIIYVDSFTVYRGNDFVSFDFLQCADTVYGIEKGFP